MFDSNDLLCIFAKTRTYPRHVYRIWMYSTFRSLVSKPVMMLVLKTKQTLRNQTQKGVNSSGWTKLNPSVSVLNPRLVIRIRELMEAFFISSDDWMSFLSGWRKGLKTFSTKIFFISRWYWIMMIGFIFIPYLSADHMRKKHWAGLDSKETQTYPFLDNLISSEEIDKLILVMKIC